MKLIKLKKIGHILKILNADLCECAVTINGFALEYIPKEFQTFNICLIALKQNKKSIKYVLNDSMLRLYQYYTDRIS
jgi:hypothetical protein